MPAPPPKENVWAKRSTGGGANEKERPPSAASSNKSALKPNRWGFSHKLWKNKYKTRNDEAQITLMCFFVFLGLLKRENLVRIKVSTITLQKTGIFLWKHTVSLVCCTIFLDENQVDADQRDKVVPQGGGGWGRGVDCPDKDKSREPTDRLGNLH